MFGRFFRFFLQLFQLLFRRRWHRNRRTYLPGPGRPSQRGPRPTRVNVIMATVAAHTDPVQLIRRAGPNLVILVAVVQRTSVSVVHHVQVGTAGVQILHRERVSAAVHRLSTVDSDAVQRGGAAGT
uniref:(northern house mosquito) hypothetical protein n=1 Tax=Culex pipiens TaxID=7175 RepID=A0A8D8E2T2_CULPI